MQNKILRFIFLISMLVGIVKTVNIVVEKRYEKKQNDLARLLGVNIDEHNRTYFPEIYFYDSLEIGMTSAEVHEVVRGYEAVYLCKENSYGDYEDELYYYYSLNDNKAMRFMIDYDAEGRYYDFYSEDANSRSFGSPDGCLETPRKD